MLVDLPTQLWSYRVDQGVYSADRAFPFNFDKVLERYGLLKSRWPFTEAVWKIKDPVERLRLIIDSQDVPYDYGVCDQWEQITERWPSLLTDERRFVIALTTVERADQPARGGWRWHKWGEYIGIQEPQYEYLHDEPEIERVYTFAIYEVNAR